MTQEGYLAWGNKYNIGVPLIDNQHKNLLKLINKLLNTIQEQGTPKDVGISIKYLQQFVIVHFGTEERLMQRNKYAGLNSHKKQHEIFIKKLNALSKEYENFGASKELKIKLTRELWWWFKNHILDTDLKLGGFLKSNNVKTENSL